MHAIKICPVCRNSLIRPATPFGLDSVTLDCQRCGLYHLSDLAADVFTRGTYFTASKDLMIADRQRAITSSISRESGPYFHINSTNYISLLETKDKPVTQKMDILLHWFEQQDTNGSLFIAHPPLGNFELQAKCWALNADELTTLVYLLVARDLLKVYEHREQLPLLYKNDGNAYNFPLYSIAPQGWEHLEQLKKVNLDSHQGFVAMWFDSSMFHVFDKAIKPGIKAAGYRAHLVNMREHTGKIDDEIIAQIRRSRFLVADMTGHRGGVYYEAGFAKGLGLEVFLTCHEDAMEELHFDIRQYNCIKWSQGNLSEFSSALTRRVEAALGHGPVKNS